jgi:hypothetical protein
VAKDKQVTDVFIVKRAREVSSGSLFFPYCDEIN